MSKKALSISSLFFLLLSYLQPFSALFTDAYFGFGIKDSIIPVFFPLVFAVIALVLGGLGMKGKIRKTLVTLSAGSAILHLIFTLIIILG